MAETMETKRTTCKAERRIYPRIKTKAKILTGQVTYPIDEDNFARGISNNISLGGIMVNTETHFEKGSLIQLRIELPGWHKFHPGFIGVLEDSIGSPFIAICEVLRCEQSDQGFATAAKFINIDPDDFVAFQGFLEDQASRV
jgi:hypothetical protein